MYCARYRNTEEQVTNVSKLFGPRKMSQKGENT